MTAGTHTARSVIALVAMLLLLVLMLVPAVADGAVKFKIRGKGYGHGVGMSQWGARQMALQGHDYKSILRQYYSDTQVAYITTTRQSAAEESIKVAQY